jgi:Winged helix DNA-binding domain
LAEQIAAAGVRTEGQALIQLLALACFRGLAVRGPMVGGQQAYALVRDWLGDQPRVDRDLALAELARRYLLGHGPADERDLARWSGLPLRDVRVGLRAIAPQLAERRDGLLDLAGRASPAALPPPRLLGAFDPLLLGWCSREAVLGTNRSVVTVNGIFRPFALVRARAVATWSMPGGEVALQPFARLTRENTEALLADGRDVVRYLAGE